MPRTATMFFAAAVTAVPLALPVLVAPASVAVTATSADATPVVTALDVTPDVAVLSPTAATTVTVTAHVTDDLGVSFVKGLVYDAGAAGQEGGATFTMGRVSGTAIDGDYQAVLRLNPQDTSGAYLLTYRLGAKAFDVEAYDATHTVDSNAEPGSAAEPFLFRVVRPAIVRGFDVAEPVRAGRYVHLRGRLLRLSGGPTSAQASYPGYSGVPVTVEFRAAGSRTWRTKLTVHSDSSGRFASSSDVRARRDGRWRAVFGGSERYAGAVSRGDRVLPR